jgi:hypothetical protein
MTRLFALRGADQYLSGFFGLRAQTPDRTKKLGKPVRTQTCPHWVDAPRPDIYAMPYVRSSEIKRSTGSPDLLCAARTRPEISRSNTTVLAARPERLGSSRTAARSTSHTGRCRAIRCARSTRYGCDRHHPPPLRAPFAERRPFRGPGICLPRRPNACGRGQTTMLMTKCCYRNLRVISFCPHQPPPPSAVLARPLIWIS